MMVLAPLILLGFTAAARSADSESNIGLGQFSVRPLSLHTMLRPGQTPNSLYVIEPGEFHATLAVGYANVWNSSTNKFLVDGEWGNLDVRLAYAVNNRIEVGFILPFSTRQGGFLDKTIDAFHETFRFESQGRGNAPENETAISFFDSTQESSFLAEGSSSGINDIPLFLVWHASEGDVSRPAIRLKSFVTLPVGEEDELEGAGEPVIGTGLMAAKRIGTSNHHLYGEIEYSYSDKKRWDGFELNQHMFGVTVIWEYRWSRRTSIVTQYNVVSGIAKDYDEWTNESHHVNLGIKRQINETVMVEISLQENIFHYNTSADIGINAAVSTVF